MSAREPGRDLGGALDDDLVVDEPLAADLVVDEPLAADPSIPRGFTAVLAAAFLVAAGYWLWHESFAITPAPLDRYLAERAAALDTGYATTDDDLRRLAADELALRAGARAYAEHCARCHGASGEGAVGPNLTDPFWIGGGAPTAIYATIVEGRAAKGMQAWGAELGPGLCKQVAAHVLALGRAPRAGRPPEGHRPPPSPSNPPVYPGAAHGRP